MIDQEAIDKIGVDIRMLEDVSDSLEGLFYELNLPNQIGEKGLLSLSADCDILVSRLTKLKKKYIAETE